MSDDLCPDDPARPVRMAMRAAAVCYRRAPDGVEFLLVRTRNLRAWTFPKGHVEPGETPLQAARREAREEAAVTGRIATTPFARYRYPVWEGPGHPSGEVCIKAYMMEVTGRSRGRSVEDRPVSWFSTGVAVRRLAEGRHPGYARELRRVIASAAAALREESEQGRAASSQEGSP